MSFEQNVNDLFEEDFEVKTGPHQRNPTIASFFAPKMPKYLRKQISKSKAWCREKLGDVSKLRMNAGFSFTSDGRITYDAPEKEEFFKLLEDVAALIMGLRIAQNKKQVLYAYTAYAKFRCGNKTLAGQMLEFMKRVTVLAWAGTGNAAQYDAHMTDAIIRYVFSDEELADMQPNSGDSTESIEGSVLTQELLEMNDGADVIDVMLKGIRGVIDSFSEFQESDLYKKVYNFFLYILTSSVFEKYGIDFQTFNFTALQEEAIRKKHHLGFNFMLVCADTITFICERALQFARTGEIGSFLHGNSAYDKWVTLALKVKADHAHFHNLGAVGTNYFDFMKNLDEAITSGLEINKVASKLKRPNLFASKMLFELQGIKNDVASKNAALETRKAPFSVVVFGGTSVAKSLFSRLLVSMYCNAFDLPLGDEHVYVRNAIDEFWVNFMTSMHTIILDDIAFMSPKIATSGDPTLMEALQINNNVPFIPTQAALEDKGRTPLRSELLIATTNKRDLNATSYFSCPGAVLRRFPWVIDLRIKDEYAKESGVLDTTKIAHLDVKDMPNYWKITVYEVVPDIEERDRDDIYKRESVRARYVERLNTENIYEFCSWFVEVASVYRSTQDRAANTLKALKDLKLCMGKRTCKCEGTCTIDAHFERGCYRPLDHCAGSHPGCRLQLNGNDIPAVIYYCLDCGMPEKECTCDLYGCPGCWQPYECCICQIPTTPTRCEQCDEEDCICLEPNSGEQCVVLRPDIMEMYYRAYSRYWTEHIEHSPRYTLAHLDAEYWSLGAFQYVYTRFLICMVWIYFYGPFFLVWFLGLFLGSSWGYQYIWGLARQPDVWRVVMKLIGSEVEHQIIRMPRGMKLMVAASGTLATSYMGYALISKFFAKDSNAGLLNAVGKKPTCPSDQGVNPWYKDDYTTTPVDVGSTSISWKTADKKLLLERLRRNVLHLRLSWMDKNVKRTVPNGGFVICGKWMVVNHHALPPCDEFSIEVVRVKKDAGISENITSRFHISECKLYPEYDIALVPLKDLPPFPDLRGLLPSEKLRGTLRGFYFGRNYDGSDLLVEKVNITNQHITNYVAAIADMKREVDISAQCWVGTTTENMNKGDCGSILIGQTQLGPVILGFHAMIRVMYPNQAYAIALSKEFIDKALEGEIVLNAGGIHLNSESTTRELGPLHSNSPFRYIESGVASVYGSLTGFRAKPTSSVTKSLICDSLLMKGYKLLHTAPEMKGWGPKRNALLAMVDPVSQFDPVILDRVTDDYYNDIRSQISLEQLRDVHPIPIREAVNGVAGLKYVDSINRSTSAGFPWMKTKKNFLEEVEVIDGNQNPVMPTQEILTCVEDCLEAYKRGERYNPIFQANLKDEAVTFAKAEAKKTRVFAGAPFHWVLVSRMYLLMFLRLMYQNPFVFEAAPGINATSWEWGRLYDYVTSKGKDRMVAGDFKNFDKKMSARVMMCAFKVIIRLCKDSGNYTDEDLLVLEGIANDTSFPWYFFFGDLVQFYGTNPSGHNLTVQINSIVNSIYMRYCYAVLSETGNASNFRRDVALMTYGDDNIMSVDPKCDWFNHTSIAQCLESVGIVYTMADKEAASVPFLPISECSFLKRTWRWDEEVGAWMAPLDKGSIEKRLLINVQSKHLDPAAQIVSSVRDSVVDAFHHGREYHAQIVRDCREALKENDLMIWVESDEFTFPSWDSIRAQFVNNNLGNIAIEGEPEDTGPV